jgi:hypothetical protein
MSGRRGVAFVPQLQLQCVGLSHSRYASRATRACITFDTVDEPAVATETPAAAVLIGAAKPHLPHLRLMYAVLEDAVVIVLGGRLAGPATLRIETINWVLADDIGWLFSFQNVCDSLDLDADRLRARLAPWLTAERRQRPALRVAL